MQLIDNIITASIVGVYGLIADVILLRYLKHYINNKFPLKSYTTK